MWVDREENQNEALGQERRQGRGYAVPVPVTLCAVLGGTKSNDHNLGLREGLRSVQVWFGDGLVSRPRGLRGVSACDRMHGVDGEIAWKGMLSFLIPLSLEYFIQ